MMTRARWVLGGVGLGAAVMYWADPRSGRARRALVREKVWHTVLSVGDALEVVGRDMAHRARGLVFKLRGRLYEEDVDDVTLEARVRSALGRVCSHPGAIAVSCRHGRVELKGPVLANELKPVLAQIRHVRGVDELDDDLEPHTAAGNHPGSRGIERLGRGRSCCGAAGRPRRASWRGWSVGLLAYGLSRRGVVGWGLSG